MTTKQPADLPAGTEIHPCPNCKRDIPMVREQSDGQDRSQRHFDCVSCAKHGHCNPDIGTVQFERDELGQFKWWKWGSKGPGGGGHGPSITN